MTATTLNPVVAGLLSLCLALTLASPTALAKEKKAKPFLAEPVSPKKSIRFYKANKQLQADRVQMTGGDTDKEGCHNMLKKTRVFKALQIGFSTCSLYQDKNCAVASLVPVQSEKQLHSSYILKEGVTWLPEGEDERGVKVASWYCGTVLEQGEMRAEHTLAEDEVKRLKQDKKDAKKELEAAQAAYAKMEKAEKKVKEYAKRTKQEAISTGAIEPDPEEDEEDKEKKDEKKDKEGSA